MFDYSLLASFILFAVFCFIKIVPALAKNFDNSIQEIRREFDEVAHQATRLQERIDALQQKAQQQKVLQEKMLVQAKQEADAIETSVACSAQRLRDYYKRLRTNGQAYWQHRLEQYSDDVLKAQVLSSVQDFCRNPQHVSHVEKLTGVMLSSATQPKSA